MKTVARAHARGVVGSALLVVGALACAVQSGVPAEPTTAGPARGAECAPALAPTAAATQSAPRAELRSWRPGGARAQIERFVAEVTELTSPVFALPADRIAVIDADGTLWPE